MEFKRECRLEILTGCARLRLSRCSSSSKNAASWRAASAVATTQNAMSSIRYKVAMREYNENDRTRSSALWPRTDNPNSTPTR